MSETKNISENFFRLMKFNTLSKNIIRKTAKKSTKNDLRLNLQNLARSVEKTHWKCIQGKYFWYLASDNYQI